MSTDALSNTIWHKGVIAATIGWLIAFFGVTTLPTSLFGLLVFGSWIALPVSIYLDSKAVSETVDWPKHRWLYLLTSLVWVVAAIAGFVYLWQRRKNAPSEADQELTPAIERVDEPAEYNPTATPDREAETDLDDQATAEVGGEKSRVSHITYRGETHFGQGDTSSNREWHALASRHGPVGTETRFFVRHGDTLAYSVEIENGQDCEVTDTGVAAVLDGLSIEDQSAKLMVFDSDGTSLLTHFFNSNGAVCALSNDGQYAAAATFNPDCSTYVFDIGLGQGNLVLTHEHVDGNNKDLEFDIVDGEYWLYLSERPGSDPYYAINLDGDVVWRSEELQRKQRLQALIESSDTADLSEAIELLDEAYELASDENERKRVASQLADTHWSLAKELDQDTEYDTWWGHLNQAKSYYTEILPWYDGKQGIAKVARKQGKYRLKQGDATIARELFQSIADLEEKYDVQLLTDADKRRLSRLSDSSH